MRPAQSPACRWRRGVPAQLCPFWPPGWRVERAEREAPRPGRLKSSGAGVWPIQACRGSPPGPWQRYSPAPESRRTTLLWPFSGRRQPGHIPSLEASSCILRACLDRSTSSHRRLSLFRPVVPQRKPQTVSNHYGSRRRCWAKPPFPRRGSSGNLRWCSSYYPSDALFRLRNFAPLQPKIQAKPQNGMDLPRSIANP